MRRIYEGQLTDAFNCAVFGLDKADKADWDTVEDNVRAEYKRWRTIHAKNDAYVDIELTHIQEDEWVLQAFLTSMAVEAVHALDRGLVWNRDSQSIDFHETSEWYERSISLGVVEEKRANALMALAREFPQLRDTRGKFVLLRMQGSLEKGVYRRPPVLTNA